MIIVSGCSWACGEWERSDLRIGLTEPSHPGLSKYLEEAGHDVVNLGIPGGSNLQVCNKISGWIQRNRDIKIDKIIVFQTEYTRDWRMRFNEDYSKIEHHDSLCNIMIARFYNWLIELEEDADCEVYVIGGASDTLDPEIVKKHYGGLNVVCQSMVNFLINHDTTVEHPIFSWYHQESIPLVEEVKRHLSDSELQKFLVEIQRGADRENIVFSTPEYFWPDGSHPNRAGHKKLFDFLLKQDIF